MHAPTVMVSPARNTDIPRTPVSMSGTYESIDANPSESRNAQIAAAGAPRRARKVPGAMMPRSPTRAIDEPDRGGRPRRHRSTVHPRQEQRGADHEDEGAEDRRRCRVGVGVIAQHRVDHQHRQHQERDRHDERPSPADRVGQQTADRRAEQPGQQPGGGHQRQHPWPDRRRQRLGDGPQRQRVRGPAGRTLHEPPHHEHRHRRRERRDQQPHEVERRGRHHERLCPEPVDRGADDRDRADHRQGGRGERPPVERKVPEVAQHRGHDRRDDQDVHRAQGLEEQQPDDQPAVPAPEHLAPRRRLADVRFHGTAA